MKKKYKIFWCKSGNASAKYFKYLSECAAVINETLLLLTHSSSVLSSVVCVQTPGSVTVWTVQYVSAACSLSEAPEALRSEHCSDPELKEFQADKLPGGRDPGPRVGLWPALPRRPVLHRAEGVAEMGILKLVIFPRRLRGDDREP